MKKWIFAILFGSALVLGACGGDDAADDGDSGESVEIAAGEAAYKNSCAACHGDDLSGASGPDLTDVGSKYSSDEIAEIIQDGKGGMPPIKVSDEDKTDIADWLASKK